MDTLCKIRDLQHDIMAFEQKFIERYGICLNEGMILCSLKKSETGSLTSGELSALLGLTHSNTSKVIASVEKKGLIQRSLGASDKRTMFFTLTPSGAALLSSINCETSWLSHDIKLCGF